MRLTLRLQSGLRDVTVRKWNKVWECRGKFYDYPPKVPEALAAKGVEVVEMNQIKPEVPQWIPPRPDDPRNARPIPPEEQPDWKDDPAWTHFSNVRLFEGIKQACLIAKAQHFIGFPAKVEQLIGAVDIPDKDLLLQRYIMQAQEWNTDEDKLPKPFHPSKPRWNYKRQYGITHHKTSLILLRNLLRLCQSQVTEFPSLASRKQVTDPSVYSHVMYRDKPVIMKENFDLLLTSDTMLPPFVGEEVVDESVLHKLPDMWPVYPTVDFLDTNNYELNSETAFKRENRLTCPHTIVQVPRKHHWEDMHHQAGQIMSCLMYTAALARRKFGEDVRILPEPISIQHISLERNNMLFTFFQLNTLDLDTDKGVKNLVWTADKDHLYEIVPGQPWLGPEFSETRYQSYNPAAFEKFLAVYLSGVPEIGSASSVSEKSAKAES